MDIEQELDLYKKRDLAWAKRIDLYEELLNTRLEIIKSLTLYESFINNIAEAQNEDVEKEICISKKYIELLKKEK